MAGVCQGWIAVFLFDVGRGVIFCFTLNVGKEVIGSISRTVIENCHCVFAAMPADAVAGA